MLTLPQLHPLHSRQPEDKDTVNVVTLCDTIIFNLLYAMDTCPVSLLNFVASINELQ